MGATCVSELIMSRRDMGSGGRGGPPTVFCVVLLVLVSTQESHGKETRQFGFNVAAGPEAGWTTFDPIPYKKQERLTTSESFTFTDDSNGDTFYVCKANLDFAIRVTTGQTLWQRESTSCSGYSLTRELASRDANLRTTTTSAKVHTFPLKGTMGRLYNCRAELKFDSSSEKTSDLEIACDG